MNRRLVPSPDPLASKHVTTPTGYLMVLRHGDDVLAAVDALAREQAIPSASFFGIGFMAEATFGFYDFSRKQFDPKTFRQVEMSNMTGSIAWKNGQPSIHAHATVADRSFVATAGHVLNLVVGTGSCEITILVHPQHLERFVDPTIDAHVLDLQPR